MSGQYGFVATNRREDGESVAERLKTWLAGLTSGAYTPLPSLSLVTGYINTAGFGAIANELEKLPRVRLLLGMPPHPPTAEAARMSPEQIRDALTLHDEWMIRERDLTAFTLEGDATRRRFVAWLRSLNEIGEPRVEVRRYEAAFVHGKAYIAEHPVAPLPVVVGSSNFTGAGMWSNVELNISSSDSGIVPSVRDWFEKVWDESNPVDLADLYERREHPPYLIFTRMLWELYGSTLEDDEVARSELGLTDFQLDGVGRALAKLEEHGGVVIADEVGLGKTYIAAEIMYRASEIHRQKVLVVAPAALKSSMWVPELERWRIWATVKSYDEIRLMWEADAAGARRELDSYALVVIDEAHNLRNSSTQRSQTVNALLSGQHPKKVVLLTATPVDNSLMDLYALVSLFVRDDAKFAGSGIPSIREYVQRAQATNPEALEPSHLYDLIDEVAVRRTREFIKNNYQGTQFTSSRGEQQTIQFPTAEVKPLTYDLNEKGARLLDAMDEALGRPPEEDGEHGQEDDLPSVFERELILARYRSSAYLIADDDQKRDRRQSSNAGLLRSALLKRLESCPYALANTLQTMVLSHERFLEALGEGLVLTGDALAEWVQPDSEEFDDWVDKFDGAESDNVAPASLYRADDLGVDVTEDLAHLRQLLELAEAADDAYDPKVNELLRRLGEIATMAAEPDVRGVSSGDRRKVLVFSTFADTTEDVHRRVTEHIESVPNNDPLAAYKGRIAPTIFGQKTGVSQSHRVDIIAGFAPRTAGKLDAEGTPFASDDYDLLFTTDVLSEGVNLQQACRIINFDLPWNPMRIVQRHGRVDRIGSQHLRVHLDVFFPSDHLERLLRIQRRLHRKLNQANAAMGHGTVIPGVASVAGITYNEQAIEDDIHRLREGHLPENTGAANGEAYRKLLSKQLVTPSDKETIAKLPHGSGSGFINTKAAHGQGYVFCIRIGDERKARLRFVPTTEQWEVIPTAVDAEWAASPGAPVVHHETLISLSSAEPPTEETPRDLSSECYERAFLLGKLPERRQGGATVALRLGEPPAPA